MEASSSTRPLQGGPPATPSHPSLLPALSPSNTLEQTPAPLHNLPPHLQQGVTPHSRPGSAQPQHTHPHPSHNQPPIPQPQFILPPGHMLQNGGGMVPQGSNVFGVVMGNAPGQGPADSNIPTNTKVYASVYSGIPVFEAMIRGISVMRRSSDSWVNATQILKVAGIPKSQRTKILEKEILTGLHEKVQGGYGKYQGTWIPLPRGKDLAAQYGVTAFISPIFDFVPSPNNVAALPLSRETPDRAAQKTPGQGMMGHYNNPMMSGGRVSSPFPQHTLHPHHPPQFSNGEGMMMPPHPSNLAYPPNMYYPPQQYAQDNGPSVGMAMTPSRSGGGIGGPLAPAPDINGMGLPPSHSDIYIDQYGQAHSTFQGQQTFITNGNGHEEMRPPSAKRQRSNEGMDFANGEYTMDQDPQLEPTQQDPVQQEEADEDTDSLDDEPKNGPPLPAAMRLANKPIRPKGNAQTSRTRSKLLGLFSTDDVVDLRAVFGLAPDAEPMDLDIDMVIDNQGHTALHWACALAKISIVKQLINLGADIHRGNYAGETALIRSVLTTNHFENGTFGELLVHLSASIRTLDHAYRTPIHHVALIAGVKGRAASARSYMTTILEWVAKEQTGQDAIGGGMSLKNLVDVQDVHGDSALNVAARVGNKGLIKLLLDAGADKGRANNLGLKPADFGVEVEALKVSPAEAVVSNLKSEVPKPERRSRDVQKNISAIFETINDTFAAEMTQKQTKLNATEASVRHATRALSDKRQQVQRAQAALSELEQVKQKVENVKRALGSLPIQDWSGRSPLSNEIQGESTIPPAFKSIHVDNIPVVTGEEIRLPERGAEGALARLRKIALWEDRIASTLEDRMRALEGESADKAVKYRRLVSLCTKVPVDQVDGSLDVLTQAIESDGTSLDLSRISGFLSRMKDAQPQGLGQAQVA